ncbi:hypothetical protein P3T36_003346 [Kitasatospora sp. MAP12-15]|uniref:hypothetical protein n=1 Tax=unclassified Kitasatospora TaxID=2633591 RepID=UPI002476F95F|nr:hypothetical protein [Kitasatospora sp. MAP12-44]MDH6111322.1 hypothetical protein [Kitasatospora sp. MAP12-44]
MTTSPRSADTDDDRSAAAEALERLARRLRTANDEQTAHILSAVFGDEGLLDALTGVAEAAAETFRRRIDDTHHDQQALPAYRLYDRYSDVCEALGDVQREAGDSIAEVRTLTARERAMGLPLSAPAQEPRPTSATGPAALSTPATAEHAAQVHFRRDDNGQVRAEYDKAAGPQISHLLDQAGFVVDFTTEFRFPYHRLLYGMGAAYDVERLTLAARALRAAGHRPTATQDIIDLVHGQHLAPGPDGPSRASAAAGRTTSEPSAVAAATVQVPTSTAVPAGPPRPRTR